MNDQTRRPGRAPAPMLLLFAALSGCTSATSDPSTGSAAAASGQPVPTTGTALLSVQMLGDASGTITASGVPLTCSALQGDVASTARLCWALVPTTSPPRVVRLTALPGGPDARFSGWGGSCAGAGTCDVTMAGAASITAVFTALGGAGQPPAGVVDPTSYGARCDGSADDAPALLAAAEAAGKSGDTIIVPCKLRLASGSAVLDGTVQLVGSGSFDLRPGASLALRGPLLGTWSRIFFLNGGILDVRVPNARVYPQWWGARGDGVADDAPAIQAAIDAASHAAIDSFEWNQGVGGTVSLPRGVYRVASPLTVRGDAVRIEGHGAHTTALRADMDASSDVLTVGDGTGAGRNVFLTDFTVYGSGANKFRDGVVVHGATWPTVQNITVSYASRYAFRIRGTLHARLSHLRARHAGTGLWIGATAGGIEATTVHVEQFATTLSTGPGVIVEKAYGVLFDQLTSESCGSIQSPATSQGIVIGTPTTGATTEVTLLHPYFEGNFGWDVEIGLDPVYAASATIVGGSYRATWTKQIGYGAIRVDRVRSGGVIGGYATGYDPPLETIRLTQNGWNFSVLGLDLPGANPPKVTGSTLDQYRGRISAYDASGDVWDRGRVVSRAGGPGGGAGIALSGGGGPPADCNAPWTVGSIVWNSSPGKGLPIGWVCTVAGAPGEWKPLPRLD
ncbi:MAG: glycosyl hydrolase family 28-related protein [Deltaproteobacteria bacterium]